MSTKRTIQLIQKDNYQGLKTGSYYVRKLKRGWILYHQSFDKGEKTATRVNAWSAYKELGFIPEWTLDEARTRCKTLNKEKTLQQSKARDAALSLVRLPQDFRDRVSFLFSR